MDVKDIVAEWLEDNGYDGLYNEVGCGCVASNLALTTRFITAKQPTYSTANDARSDRHAT